MARLIEACAKTCKTDYVLHFGLDVDDLSTQLTPDSPPVTWTSGTRMGLAAWTNYLAAEHPTTPYLCSIGDDMLPETDGWDERLITAIEHMGGGFAYPFDGRRTDIPECCMVDTRIVAELGWFALPTAHHWFIDNVWSDLGKPDRIAYLSDVKVMHLHPKVSPAPHDQTYEDAAGWLDKDLAAYQAWRLRDMRRDRARVRGCLA